MEDYMRATRLRRFKNIFADAPRKEALYSGLLNQSRKGNTNKPIVRVNQFFIATSGRGPDGSFSIIDIDKTGDIPSNEPLVRKEGQTGIITDLSFNPFSDQILASASAAKPINIWKIPRRGLTSDLVDPIISLVGHLNGSNAIKFHPTTENLLVSASMDNSVRLWDVSTGDHIYTSHHNDVIDIIWNNIGDQYILRSTSYNSSICDARSGLETASLSDTVGNFLVIPAGKPNSLLSIDSTTNVVKSWDLRNTSTEVQFQHVCDSISEHIPPACDPDVELLYIADKSNRQISVFDCSTNNQPLEKLFTYQKKSSPATAIALVPRRAISISVHEVGRILKLSKEKIESITFAVTHEDDSFDDALYPDTFSGEASQTKQEWLEVNSNLPPRKMSMQPLFVEAKLKEKRDRNFVKDSLVDSSLLDSSEIFGETEISLPLQLINGTALLKFSKRGSPQEKKVFIENGYNLTWRSALLSWKLGKTSCLDLRRVLRVQRGQMTVNFNKANKSFGAAKYTAFSLIYLDGRNEKTLDFIAQSKGICDLWFSIIDKIVKQHRSSFSGNPLLASRFLNDSYSRQVIKDYSKMLSSNEICFLLEKLGIVAPAECIHEAFAIATRDHSFLSLQLFEKFMFTLRRRFDLEYIWGLLINDKLVDEVLKLQIPETISLDSDFSEKNSTLCFNKFCNFWFKSTYPCCNVSDLLFDKKYEDEALRILATCMGDDFNPDDPFLSYLGFYNLMNSELNDAYDPNKLAQYQDMSYPLSFYLINSSHNTYLEADQITGYCSANRYINDLIRGVRCVELDTADGVDGDPVVTHIGTVVNKIKFIHVIEAIKTYAFHTSPYPVLLSIENHCTEQQQRRMAKSMRSIFGDALLDSSQSYYAAGNVELLSPEDLKGKILIKGTRLKGDLSASRTDSDFLIYDEDDDDGEKRSDNLDSSITGSMDLSSGRQFGTIDCEGPVSFVDDVDHYHPQPHVDILHDSIGSEGYPSSISDSNGSIVLSPYARFDWLGTRSIKREVVNPKIHEFLSSVTYFAKIKHKGSEFQACIPADHVYSFNEDNMERLSRNKLASLIEYNKYHISRVYPRNTRVDSSNYNPIRAWRAGVQLAAINTQTHDIPNIVNDGMFRQNGRSGFVLKPDFFLYQDSAKQQACRIRVNVISGQNLPATNNMSFSPIVMISVNGESETKIFETSAVKNNLFNPLWNEVFDFTLERSDLSQLTFVVKADKKQMNVKDGGIACGSIPISCIRSGFRIVRLYDEHGRNDFELEYSSLFIHLSKEFL